MLIYIYIYIYIAQNVLQQLTISAFDEDTERDERIQRHEEYLTPVGLDEVDEGRDALFRQRSRYLLLGRLQLLEGRLTAELLRLLVLISRSTETAELKRVSRIVL